MKYSLTLLLLSFIGFVSAQNNIGIGTSVPKGRLQISGSASYTNPPVLINSVDGSGVSYLKFERPGVRDYNWSLMTRAENDPTGQNSGMFFYHGIDSVNSLVRMILNLRGNGRIGIGNVTPTNPLTFMSTLEKKIALFPGSTGDAGFAVFANELRQYIDDANGKITFGFDNFTNGFTEYMRIASLGNVGIGTNQPKGRLHVADSAVLFTGTVSAPPLTTTINPPVQGAGTRMFWFPALGAFRAGYVDAVQWDRDSIGQLSFAAGYNAKAKGRFSVAFGNNSTASGDQSFAGGNSIAGLDYSTAFGNSTASGNYSTSMGKGTASGNYSTSMGRSTASGNYSTSMGGNTIASGDLSTSMGQFSEASGVGSTASGGNSTASGNYSFSSGEQTFSKARGAFSAGVWNDNTDNPDGGNPAPTDRIFQIGNGTSTTRSNALTILRNGYIGIGEPNPQFPLTFSGVLGDMISFRTTGGGFYGFGIDFDRLQIHAATSTTDVSFGYGNNAAFTERARIINGGEFGMSITGRLALSTGTQSAGVWLSNTANNAYPSFIGMRSDNLVGFYGNGSPNNGWGLLMNTDNGRVGIGTDNPTQALHVVGNGFFTGSVTQSSDARLKKNIIPLRNTLPTLQQLNGYTYQWIDENADPSMQIGLLAQELQKVYPELVKENDKGILSVNYSGMVPVLLQAIKEQQQQIEEMKKMIKLLNEKIK